MKPEELKEALKGICAISVTPMTEGREVSYEGMRNHIRFLKSKGITKENNCTLVVGGSTGECGALTIEERKKLIETAVDEAGDELPIIAGCNHSNIVDVKDLMKHAQSAGAAGVMVLSPYYYVPTDEAVLRFYREISECADIGILLYNNIEVTHKDVPVEVLEQLVDSSNVVGIKECTPNFVKMEKVVRKIGNKIAVINGHGEFLEPFAALAGTVGFISSTSNFAPEIAVEMWKKRSAGKYEEAKKVRDRLTPYLDLAGAESATGGEPVVLAILKRAATLVGSDCGPGRIPLPDIDDALDAKIRNMLKEVGLI
ncbi:dihydrodipicolinate synthase family protein [Ruminococcus sp. CLA-AA-H200]|uniref:Dihydrodipicolinate synthase family protein n=1 Tax=Ruminococcus turbiniformis TaxID=2881258 RepID=A0ABS8FYC1_9FIRM|nr:dihydrodipicolinate synthase family protein [Ruminococcus turbiniformis]MCC2255045.1 dihydrodipicolinate synthase family protein [Ruminococcus turbiniformis]